MRNQAAPRGLAARYAALPRRRQEFAADAGLATALAAVNVVAILPYQDRLHPAWLAVLLVIGQAIPLAWRRRYPVAAALVIAVARVAYDRIGFGFAPFPVGPAIALYTVVDRRGPVWRWFSLLLVAIGITLSQTGTGHTEPYDAMFQAFIFLTAWAAGVLSRATRANLRAAEARAARAEAELDAEAARAAELERTRIARELHDVGRLLGVLRAPGEPLETAPAASLSDIGQVLDQMCDAGLRADLDVLGTPYPLAPGIDLAVFRIVQEALTNTLRHSAAAKACVTVRYEPGYVTVAVTDRGPRRDPSPGGAGLGLAGIAERVASCGGRLTIGPTPADGFAVSARLPAR